MSELAAPPDEADEAARSGAGRALRWFFGLQLALAVAVMGGDLLARLPASLPGPGQAPGPDVPVSPGDQTRRFEPARLMSPTPGGPGAPGSAAMPRRLAWREIRLDDEAALAVTGAIAPGDAGRFSDYLDGAAERPAVVTLHSPGGSVSDALAIGRELRGLGIDTRVEDGEVCLSACPYVLASGGERVVSRGASVGVHQHYFGRNTVLPAFLAVADIQRGQAEILTYLDEMGVDPMLAAKAMQTPSDDIYLLVPDELEGLGLATRLTP